MKAYSSIRNISFAVLSGALLLLAGCKKSDEENNTVEVKTITETIMDEPSLSILESAVIKANLGVPLASSREITLFAPDDAALTAAGLTDQAVAAASPDDLKTILQYHVISGRKPAAELPAGPNTAVVTLGGDSVFITRNAAGVFVNGVQVKTADIFANNGAIHILNGVLMPPSGDIVETAMANPDFSYLVAAVTRASTGTTNIAGALAAGGPLTVFAPTNQAFIDAGFSTVADIQAANADTLAAILLNHVIAGRVFSSDLVDGAMPATAGGDSLTVRVSGQASVQGAGNTEASNIIAANIVADNGVIHVIDRVLLPRP